MASKSVKALGRVLFWRYRRGSWQYDILCALILAFIFLTPKEVFQGAFFSDSQVEEDLKDSDEANPPLSNDTTESKEVTADMDSPPR